MASAATNPAVGVSGQGALRQDQVQTDGKQPAIWTDEAACNLIWQDYQRSRMYLENNAWIACWEENDILYQSPYLGENANDPRYARVSRFGVNNQTNTMCDAVKRGLFAQKPPYFLRPRGKTTERSIKAWTALLDVLLDRMKFQYWTGLVVDSQGLHGTGIGKGGWATRTVYKPKRKRKTQPEKHEMPAGNVVTINTKESDEFDVEMEPVVESYPWFEFRMIGTTLFDPGWRTPNEPNLSSKYAIDVDYPTWHDLEEMRELDCYNIPDDEWLKAYCFNRGGESEAASASNVEQVQSDQGSPVMHAEDRARSTSADPLQMPIMLIERTDARNVMTALRINGQLVCIRNDANEFNRLTHFTANWRNILNTGYGIGIGRLVGGDQRLEQGTLNHAINLLSYQLSPAILVAAGMEGFNANRAVSAGGFFPVTPLGGSVENAMAVMKMPEIPAEAWQMIQYAKTSSQEASGADATFMQGQLQGPGSSAARTATGAGQISMKANSRVQTPVENVELGVIVPFITFLIDMVKLKMPLAEIRGILRDKLAEELAKEIFDDLDNFLDAEMEVEVLAASRLAAKVAMAQQIPWLMQVFQQPQILEQLHAEGKTADLQVILDILFDVSEFRQEDDIIRDLTPQEQAMVQQAAPGVQKIQEALAVEKQRGQNALDKSDRDAENKLGTTVAEKAMDRLGEGIPMERAEGLVMRGDDENLLRGLGPSPLAGA